MARRKPSLEALKDPERFTPVSVGITAYRDNLTGNLYFVPDNENTVLDKYIQVVDVDGIPVASRRRSGLGRFGRSLLKGVIAVFANKAGLPVGVANALLKIGKKDREKLLAVKEAFDLSKKNDYRAAALKVADALGAKELRDTVDMWSEEIGNFDRDSFEKRVMDLIEERQG